LTLLSYIGRSFFKFFVAFLEYLNFKDLRASKGLSYQEFKLDYLIRYINLSLIYVSMGTWYFKLEKGVRAGRYKGGLTKI
jgi:hypothetical protein